MSDALYSSWVYEGTSPLARLNVPREPFLSGRLSLRELLEAVPPPLLDAMKATVANNARHLQVSLDHDPADEVGWLLQRIRAHALKAESARAGAGARS